MIRRSHLTVPIHTLSICLEDDDDNDDNDMIVTAWNNQTARAIPMELIQGFPHVQLPNKAQFLSNLTVNGLRYTISSKHQGNSCVLFKPLDSEQVAATQIEFILQIQVSGSMQTLIIVHRHLGANIFHDPCLRFPVLRAKFYSSKLDHLKIINAAQITSHYAFVPCRDSLWGQEPYPGYPHHLSFACKSTHVTFGWFIGWIISGLSARPRSPLIILFFPVDDDMMYVVDIWIYVIWLISSVCVSLEAEFKTM